MKRTEEHLRLEAHRTRQANWKNWGPYLSERAWGTVREDYSADGSAWDYFPHDHARSRAYRWNEDGLAGISDRNQYICFAIALWNGQDPILKERLFGLTGPEGNHGEDVKEQYFYLDNTPTHSYMKMLYRYPQRAFPYADLVAENRRRGFAEAEYELLDTGIFADDVYFDVLVEYAKAYQEDILIRVTLTNRAPQAANYYLLPTIWFRNTWRWGYPDGPMRDVPAKPSLQQVSRHENVSTIALRHGNAGNYYLHADEQPALFFTENDTNNERLFHTPNAGPYVKDAFHRHLVNGEPGAINPDQVGTKAAAYYHGSLAAGQSITFRLRLAESADEMPAPFAHYEAIFAQRQAEADAFYEALQPSHLCADERMIQRQAFAGLLWTKQLYYYDMEQWLAGDPGAPPPPTTRRHGRNSEWIHLSNFDIISMPDKWEYPWYATWDLAFHTVPLTLLDPDFARRQLILLTREWYMHPNGQLPAYEWAFGDVNPPVHAWAAWRVFKIDAKQSGRRDREFLEAIFHKLLLNFTWWTNRKDADDNNIFQGGFLGLDNIGVFDRSAQLPTGGHIDQSDGTAWMGFYCLEMMRIALELAKEEPVYQDLATKFFEHFLRIAYAMTGGREDNVSLWDEEDGFFYDVLHLPDERVVPLKVRSLVGLLPLIGVQVIEQEMLDIMPVFDRRTHWFLENRPRLSGHIAGMDIHGVGHRRLASFLTRERLLRLLHRMLDEEEFLSPYGIRSLSKYHEQHPYDFFVNGHDYSVSYQPAESRSGVFGGNSNWRGPVWFPINFLIIEALQKYHHFYGNSLTVAFPTGSTNQMTLGQVATELSRRLINIFRADAAGTRPVFGEQSIWRDNPHWRDLILFYEYFHGDGGGGHGASHQTGWTALVAKLIQQSGREE